MRIVIENNGGPVTSFQVDDSPKYYFQGGSIDIKWNDTTRYDPETGRDIKERLSGVVTIEGQIHKKLTMT